MKLCDYFRDYTLKKKNIWHYTRKFSKNKTFDFYKVGMGICTEPKLLFKCIFIETSNFS